MSKDERRFVRGCCRDCGAVSPVCDQQTDVHRWIVGEWWVAHKRDVHAPELDWEVAPDEMSRPEPQAQQAGTPNPSGAAFTSRPQLPAGPMAPEGKGE